VRRLARRLAPVVRDWPIHRWVAVGLVVGTALPAGLVTVAFGDIWPARPAVLYVILAAAQVLPLWWIGRRPVLALAATSVAFLVTQAFSFSATTADLAIFVGLATVGALARPRTAIASASVVAGAIAVLMVVAQAPGQPGAIVEALFPAAVIVAVPTLIGLSFQGLRPRARAGPMAPDPPPAGTEPPRLGLTARELTILDMVAEGLTNNEIAVKLSIGRETVKTHVGNILAKLGARDRTHAVTVAYRNGLLDPR